MPPPPLRKLSPKRPRRSRRQQRPRRPEPSAPVPCADLLPLLELLDRALTNPLRQPIRYSPLLPALRTCSRSPGLDCAACQAGLTYHIGTFTSFLLANSIASG